jgi:hypothetical protein
MITVKPEEIDFLNLNLHNYSTLSRNIQNFLISIIHRILLHEDFCRVSEVLRDEYYRAIHLPPGISWVRDVSIVWFDSILASGSDDNNDE